MLVNSIRNILSKINFQFFNIKMNKIRNNQSYSLSNNYGTKFQCSANLENHSCCSNTNRVSMDNLSLVFEKLFKNVLQHQKMKSKNNSNQNKKSTTKRQENNDEENQNILQIIKNLIAIIFIFIFIYILLSVGWSKISNDFNDTKLVSINFHNNNSTDNWFVLKNLTIISSSSSVSSSINIKHENNTKCQNISAPNLDDEIMMNNRQFVKYLFDNINLWFNDD